MFLCTAASQEKTYSAERALGKLDGEVSTHPRRRGFAAQHQDIWLSGLEIRRKQRRQEKAGAVMTVTENREINFFSLALI